MTPFYKKALALFTSTQKAQIEKGLAKYPEPFNPHNWTTEELLNHALEEVVDCTHYLVGLKEVLDKKDEELDYLRFEKKRLQKQLARLHGQIAVEAVKKKPIYSMDENGNLTRTPKYSDQDDQY